MSTEEVEARIDHAYEMGIDEGRKEGKVAIYELRAKVKAQRIPVKDCAGHRGYKIWNDVLNWVLAEIDALNAKSTIEHKGEKDAT